MRLHPRGMASPQVQMPGSNTCIENRFRWKSFGGATFQDTTQAAKGALGTGASEGIAVHA